jgi:pimeloyl-ACP methyl ester carboxylesterase
VQNARTKTAAAGALACAVSLGCLANAAVATPEPSTAAAGHAASSATAGHAASPAAVRATSEAAAPVSAAGLAKIAWRPCPKKDPVEGAALRGLQCATLRVPLDYGNPRGRKITLALARAKHTARRSQGVVLLNRGGPGAHGRDLAALFSQALPKDVASQYDWIGVDARGVGASKPALVCDTTYQNPGRARPDVVPANAAEERAWLARVQAYTADCRRKYGSVLPHMGTRNWVRDMEAIRIALKQRRINYFGYSYGTYLGAAYATAYPDRVRRMVLDSVVRPSGVWYRNNLDQNVAFEKRIQSFFAWVAEHHRT